MVQVDFMECRFLRSMIINAPCLLPLSSTFHIGLHLNEKCNLYLKNYLNKKFVSSLCYAHFD